MNRLFKVLMGERLPTYSATLSVKGINKKVTILRDKHAVPHIYSENEEDAWFSLGFCQAQDRSFQIQTLIRLGRGRLAEGLGKRALPIDLLIRRIGFYRAAKKQFEVLDENQKINLKAFVAGVNLGFKKGLHKQPHEFSLLKLKYIPMLPEDSLCVLSLISFLLPTNWDCELIRLKTLLEDGPEALHDIDTISDLDLPKHEDLPKHSDSGEKSELYKELTSLLSFIGSGGGSNNWALRGNKTKSGKPILANDPHLAPMLPCQWYLAHIHTPEFNVLGAGFAGAPGIISGHNEYAAWGVTAGMVDNVDLYIEEFTDDQKYLKGPDGPESYEVLYEKIKVRFSKDVVEKIIVSKRGPIISPALDHDWPMLSLQATWLQAKPVTGMFGLHHVKTFDDFTKLFDTWLGLPINYVYADRKNNIGWQLVGNPPIRKVGKGKIPLPAWLKGVGWEDSLANKSDMPFLLNPKCGFVGSANQRPPIKSKAYISDDFLDDYRYRRICEELENKNDWTVESTLKFQLDVDSLIWREIKPNIMIALNSDLSHNDRRLEFIKEKLSHWDGKIEAGSAAASIFEVFMVDICGRAVKSKAPHTAQWVLGEGFAGELSPGSMFGLRRAGWIAKLLQLQPQGYFVHSWDQEILRSLIETYECLKLRFGSDSKNWKWGSLRKIEFRHPLGELPVLRRVFNLGPYECPGDANTVFQAGVHLGNWSANPVATPTYRMVVDLDNFDNSRFILSGGQSGNPMSKHYSDMMKYWLKGEGVLIAFSEKKVKSESDYRLVLNPK